MVLIVAVDDKFGIGREGNLLTYLPEDLAFFKKMTLGKTIVIGRKTLESFKNGAPLPKRQHIVMTRTKTYDHPRIAKVSSVEQLFKTIEAYNSDEVFVSGGGNIYELLLPYCQKAYVTMIEADLKADTFMPDLRLLKEWRCTEEGPWIKTPDFRYRHTTWVHEVS
ncbi:MAG: diacylglycerol kinase [Firmicutes bacterium HGW-Firmicutes-2]|jgi:dihydrofolate reductase|nr:MAG: diacylglycerol kinase [Firmicutes bacterium HGW-Firmicutes-2]